VEWIPWQDSYILEKEEPVIYYEQGLEHNLIVNVDESLGDKWSVDVILLVRFQFIGFTESDMNSENIWEWKPLSQKIEDWKKDFRHVVEKAWTPSFELNGEIPRYGFLKKKVVAFLTFTVLDVDNLSMTDDFVKQESGDLRPDVKVLRAKVFPGSGDGAQSNQWTSEISLLAGDLLEEVKGTKSNGKQLKQIDAAHEVGHALGFDHPFGTHGKASYGEPDLPEADDIMGLGMNAWGKQQRLFKKILNDLFNCTWRIHRPAREQHSFQRIEPRARDGIGGGHFVIPGPMGAQRNHYA